MAPRLKKPLPRAPEDATIAPMLRLLTRVADDNGQDLAEYGIALSVAGAFVVAAAIAIGLQVGSIWDPVDSTVSDVINGNHGHHHGGGNSGNGGGNGPG